MVSEVPVKLAAPEREAGYFTDEEIVRLVPEGIPRRRFSEAGRIIAADAGLAERVAAGEVPLARALEQIKPTHLLAPVVVLPPSPGETEGDSL